MVASHHLFDKMRKAGVTTAYVILRDGKRDIPAYFGDGKMVGMDIRVSVVKDSRGPPESLNRAFPFVNLNRWLSASRTFSPVPMMSLSGCSRVWPREHGCCPRTLPGARLSSHGYAQHR